MFGNDFGDMLMKISGSCPKCGTTISFEEGASLAKKSGIKDNVVMCKKCHSVFTIEMSMHELSFTADVTKKYAR
jgi:uncharacterized Zn finger protein